MTPSAKIKNFIDLEAWKEGHKLVLIIYHITRNFPKEEMFGLRSQMRRAAVSITSNIAEGFARRSSKEKIQFYYIAQGSDTELQNQLIIGKDVQFISEEQFREALQQAIRVNKILSALIASIQRR